MSLAILGIDISKDTFDVALLHAAAVRHAPPLANTPEGFRQLQRWLEQQHVPPVHACLEATGSYGEELATFLYAAGHVVSIVNPAAVKDFGKSELRRTKTDRTDAGLLARFCQQQQPRAWHPLPPELRDLQALLRRLESLQQMRQMEANRLSSGLKVQAVVDSVQESLTFLDGQIRRLKQHIHDQVQSHPHLKQQRDLLTSIPGIGEQTAASLLAEFPDLAAFASAREVAAYAGLTPQQRESGSSVRGRAHLSKIGSARLRKLLYMPAIVAQRYNVILHAFAQRLRARGKHAMVVLAAVMRKLLHLAYGVLKSGRPFDPNYPQATT